MFRKNFVVINFLFILVFNVLASGSSSWKSFSSSNKPTPAEIEVLEQNNKGVLLSVSLSGINIQELQIDKEKFHLLSIPQGNWTDEIGKPKMPVIRTFLIAPFNDNLRIQVEDKAHINLKGYKVFPVEMEVVKNPRSDTTYIDKKFAIDEEFYASDRLYPEELARISFAGYLRDVPIVQLEIRPIRYNPQSDELICYNQLNIRLSYDGNSSAYSKGLGPLSSVGENNIINYGNSVPYAPMFSNFEGGNVIYPEKLMDNHNADYIIIAPEPFYSSEKLKELANWRAQYSGLDVAIASAEKLYYSFGGGGVSKEEMIRSFVKYTYNFWKSKNTHDGRVAYVLLVGDVDFIPIYVTDRTSFGEIVTTDNFYACVSGDDLMPDVMLGRLPANSVYELNIMIDKIIQYEQNPVYGDWSNSALLLTGTVESLYEDMKYARDEYLLPAGYNVTELSVLDGKGASHVASELNNGQHIVDYAGHGWVNGWEIFQNSDINKLKNDRKLPAIFSLACSTGYFDHPKSDSIAESLLKSRYGAIAFFGATRLASISDVGFGLSEAVARSHIYTLGEITTHTKLKLLPNSINMDLYNLIGDPALNLSAARSQPGFIDLIVSPVDISFEPEKPDQGQQMQIKVTINNFGVAEARDVTLELREKPDGDIIKTHKIPKISPNSKIDVITDWAPPLGQAQHQIFAKAYAANLDTERFRNNNSAVKRLIVSLESKGWPVNAVERNLSAPVIADIDGDGYMEVLIQTNMARNDSILIWQHDGKPAAGWPRTIPRGQYDSRLQYYNASAGPTPAVGDLDGDDMPEIVAAFFTREIYAWRNDGSYLPGWPIKTNGYATTSPVLADLDNDGKMEVICGLSNGEIQVRRYDGSFLPGWPISIGKTGHLFPIVIDINSDDQLEIAALHVPTTNTGTKTSFLYLWRRDGTLVDGFPVQMTGGNAILPPAGGDLDGDGKGEIVVVSVDGNTCRVYLWDHTGKLKPGWPITTDEEIRSAVALADLDRDGDIEIIATSRGGKIYAWHHNSQKVFGWHVDLGDYSWHSAPVIGDIDGDGNIDVIFTSYGGTIQALKQDGKSVEGWPAITEDAYTASPVAIADMNGDGRLEIVYSSGSGKVHKLFLPGSFASRTGIEWSMFGHDQMNTGSYNSKMILPLPPTDLIASDVPNDKGESITLSWELSPDDNRITGYVIYRANSYEGKYTILGKVPRGATSYIDDTVIMGQTYWYVIRASNSTYLSIGSNVTSAYPINNFAPNPPVIYAKKGGMDRVINVWWAVGGEPNLAGYILHYGTSPGEYTNSILAGKAGYYELSGLTNGVLYYIAISAFDTEGNESIKSNVVSIMPEDEDTDPPTFSSFSPKEVAEGTPFYIKCQISDPSGIFDDSGESGQGVYLIWDNDGELSSSFQVLQMSLISSGLYSTDKKIPGRPLGETIVYQVYAWDNDYDWNDPSDRTLGISPVQTIKIVSAPSEVYNYPNPVGKYTDKTHFRYYVGYDADVAINIYDVSGALVKSFPDETAIGGKYSETEWDISQMASGIYIYTIAIQSVSGEEKFIKKKLAIIR